MRPEKVSETPDEGFMESNSGQVQSTDGTALEEFSCEKGTGSGEISVKSIAVSPGVHLENCEKDDVKVAAKLTTASDGSGSESIELKKNDVVAEGGHTEGSNSSQGLSFVPESSRECCSAARIVESDSGAQPSEETREERAVDEDLVAEGNEKPLLHRVDSQKKIEVSGDGISLFVEVFGPLDGISEGGSVLCKDEVILSGIDSGEDKKCEENVAFSDRVNKTSTLLNQDCMFHVKRSCHVDGALGGENEDADSLVTQEVSFALGELVWIQTKTQLWWPGMVSNAAESGGKQSFLVNYFGYANSAQCSSFQLKPFLQYLEQMSKQNSSRSFLDAVEKALVEIGQRVKKEMTSYAFHQQYRLSAFEEIGQAHEGNSKSEDVKNEGSHLISNFLMFVRNLAQYVTSRRSGCIDGEVGAFSLSHFEPAGFLAYIRYLGRCVSKPSRIEYTTIQNCLSAYQLSTGHPQLPLHQLSPITDDEDNAEGKDEDADDLSGSSSLASLKREGEMKPLQLKVNHGIGDDGNGVRNISAPIELPSETPSHLENADGNLEGTPVQGIDSRERKKSRYLSFPYVNLKSGHKTSPASEDCQRHELKEDTKEMKIRPRQSKDSILRKKSKDKHADRKRSTKPNAACRLWKLEDTSIPSSKMLSELRSTALDCNCSNHSSDFDSIGGFFYHFRRFAFLSYEEADKHIGNQRKHKARVEAAHIQDLTLEKGVTNSEYLTSESNNSAFGGSGNHKPQSDNKKRTRKKKGDLAGPDTNPTAGSLNIPMNINSSTNEKSQDLCSDELKKSVACKKRKKVVEKSPEVCQTNNGGELPDLNGNNTGFSVEDTQRADSVASKGKLVTKRKRRKDGIPFGGLLIENVVSPNIDASIASTSLLKDVEVRGPFPVESIPHLKNKDEKETFLCWSSEPFGSQMSVYWKQTSPEGQQIIDFSSVAPTKPERRRRRRKEKQPNALTNQGSSLPDLNGNAAETSLLATGLSNANSVELQNKPKRKRRQRNKLDGGIPTIKALNCGGAIRDVLLLNFAPGFPLPSKESLIEIFSKFGSLNDAETKVLTDLSAQVVFMKSSDARDALQSLEKSSPFGPALESYHLQKLPDASKTLEPCNNNLLMLQSLLPIDGLKTPAKSSFGNIQNGETPDLISIKQNLEMMTAMLEKAGHDLSPQMKAKLETEIKGFLQKVSSMVGSSSS